MPAAQPAGASGVHKNTSVPFEHRLRLCELAFGPAMIAHPEISISSVEKDLPPPNFTIRTLAWIKGTLGFKTVALLLGQDQLASFDRWRAPEEILKAASIIAVSRSEISGISKETTKTTAQNLVAKLGLSAEWVDEESAWKLKEKGSRIFLIQKRISDAESTLIRQSLQDNSETREGWLPSSVLEYIKANQLFRERI